MGLLKKLKRPLWIGEIILILASLWYITQLGVRKTLPSRFDGEKTVTQSGFLSTIQEAEKKVEEARRAEDERRQKEEVTQRFKENYGPCRSLPVLMYHHVNDLSGWLFVKKETFQQQMDYLAQGGYTTVTLLQIVRSLRGEESLPVKPIVLTFDDGYRDFYDNAYPILRNHNFQATVFIISQLVDGGDYLSWEQIRQMAESSLITIGNHTLSHRSLSILSTEQIKNEIISAQRILKEKSGKEINVFSYPFGKANGKTGEVLKQAGFLAAVTTRRGLSCAKLPYDLPRIRVGNAPLSSYGL